MDCVICDCARGVKENVVGMLGRIKSNGIPVRATLVAVAFLGMAFNYALRSSLGLTIVAMVDYSKIPHKQGPTPQETCWNMTRARIDFGSHITNSSGDTLLIVSSFDDDGGNNEENGPFVWSETVQQLVISAFFWGYLVLQIPGGRFAEIFGAKRTILLSNLGSAMCTLLIPIAAKLDYALLLLVRFCMGLFQAACYPAMTVLMAKWSGPSEQSRMNACIKTGSLFGVFAVMPAAGWLIGTLGWESVFYVTGATALLWCLLWNFLVYESPLEHPRIPEEEKAFITGIVTGTNNVEPSIIKRKSKAPWKAMATSLPLWAATSVSFSYGWSFTVMLSMTPTYLKVMLGFDIKTSAMLTGLPYLARAAFAITYSYLADWAVENEYASSTIVRKLSTVITGVPRAIGLLIISFVKCDTKVIVGAFVITEILNGASSSAITPGLMQMSPNFAGTLYGIFNMGFTMAAIVGPMVSAYMIEGDQTFENWARVFQLAAGLTVISCLLYCLFGTAELQPWNNWNEELEAIDAEDGVQKNLNDSIATQSLVLEVPSTDTESKEGQQGAAAAPMCPITGMPADGKEHADPRPYIKLERTLSDEYDDNATVASSVDMRDDNDDLDSGVDAAENDGANSAADSEATFVTVGEGNNEEPNINIGGTNEGSDVAVIISGGTNNKKGSVDHC